MEKILLTMDGYNQYINEIEKLKNRLKDNNLSKKQAYEEAPGDGWHDNFSFEDIVRTEENLLSQIENMIKINTKIEIIKRKTNNKNIVDIGDNVRLRLTYDDGSIEEDDFELNANYNTKHLQEISVNSPLGKAIYHKEIKKAYTYQVNDIVIKVEILDKNN